MNLAKRFLEANPGWDSKLFYLWGHSYEFEVDNNWDVLEDFFKLISGREDIWYATNIEIYDYVHAYKQLIFDVNMTTCYNPTCTDIWFTYGPKDYVVKGGETISI